MSDQKIFACWLAPVLILSDAVQESSAQENNPEKVGLADVTVTARKREENLQDIPVAVSVLTEQDLQYRQIESTDQLAHITPNLTLDSVSPSSGSSSAAQIFIRGIGQTDFTPVTDPGVGLYVDGIYRARSVGNVLDFLDVDRVEILRGPQGTLFGRNTIGGAVTIYSKRPTNDFNGSLQSQFGNDNLVYVTGKINGPIIEGLAGNLAYAYRDRDGYVNRVFDNQDTGDDHSHSVRGSLLWSPTETFNAYVTSDHTAIRENGAPSVSGGVNDKQAFATFGNALLPGCTAVNINPRFPAAGPPSFPAPGVGTGGASGCFDANSFSGEYTSEGTFPVKSDVDVWGIGLELSAHLRDGLDVKSITGYRELHLESSRDGDNTPANIFATLDFFDHQQISQEFQLSGRLADRLQWLLGLYYFQEEGSNINPVILPVGAIQSGGFYDNDSIATFFQGTYDVTSQLAVTFGARYTEDTKRFTPDQYAIGDASMAEGSIFEPTWPLLTGVYLSPNGPMPAGARLLPFQEFKVDFSDASLMVNLAYDFTDQFMTYLTYSQGFKSGGFDQRFAAPPIDPDTGIPTQRPSTFNPETADSYEIGMKSQGFDNRVRLNAALFYTDYQDLQIIIRETFNPITFNGGTADIFGGELELTWEPTAQWYFTTAVGYIDAAYDKLSESVLTNATPVFPGNQLVNTPKWSTAVGAAYTFDLRDGATLTPRLDWSFHGKQFNDAVNTPQLFQDSYHLVNASVALKNNDGHWEGILAFRNVLDEKYLITGNSAFSTSASYLEQVYGRPFGWEISIRYNFF